MTDEEKTDWERDVEKLKAVIDDAVDEADLEVATVDYISGRRFHNMFTVSVRGHRDVDQEKDDE